MNTRPPVELCYPTVKRLVAERNQKILAETARILATPPKRQTPATPPAPALNALRERAITVWDSHGVSRRLFPTQQSFIAHCLKTAKGAA
ncbi:MAG: hypothetical protein LM522_11870 [Candidatus Contendobacter sp.]|nr:hypothetical protein [Candidatus Contendobacter sp.]